MCDIQPLIETIDRLLAHDGCPWDREQTLQSMRHSLIEESYELIEAIDLEDNQNIEEELGDLLFLAVFLSRLAEKENRFTLKDAVNHIVTKLIRRHPHIFGEGSLNTSEEVLIQWEKIKKGEKSKESFTSALDGIPKDLPALARAQKVAKKLRGKNFLSQRSADSFSAEERAGEMLWSAVQQMDEEGIQAEQALRKRLAQIEKEFREQEKKSSL